MNSKRSVENGKLALVERKIICFKRDVAMIGPRCDVAMIGPRCDVAMIGPRYDVASDWPLHKRLEVAANVTKCKGDNICIT